MLEDRVFECLPPDYQKKACMDGYANIPKACSRYRKRGGADAISIPDLWKSQGNQGYDYTPKSSKTGGQQQH